MDYISDRTDDGNDIFTESPQTDVLQEVGTKKGVREKLKYHSGGKEEPSISYLKAVRKSLRFSSKQRSTGPSERGPQKGGIVSADGCS